MNPQTRRNAWQARRRGVLPLAALIDLTAAVGWATPSEVRLPWMLTGLTLYLLVVTIQMLRPPVESTRVVCGAVSEGVSTNV